VVGRAFNVVDGLYPTSHDIARFVAGHFDLEVDLVDDPDAGPSYEARQGWHAAMVTQGMQPHIFLTKERFRFLRKANRNNRVSLDALLATGFRLEHTDLEASIGSTIAWYRDHRWIL